MWALSSQRSRVISGSRPAARAHVGRSTSIPALSRCSGIGSKGAAKGPELDPADLDQHVFCRPDSKPTHPQLLSAAFKKLVSSSGLQRIRIHDLRHTHATLLLKAGVPIKVVSERLGHSTPGFTMATYQHVIPGMQEEAGGGSAHVRRHPRRLLGSTAFYRLLPGGGLGRRAGDRVRGSPDPEGLSPGLTWWRGQDLTLRPSGYEGCHQVHFSSFGPSCFQLGIRK